MNNGTYIRFDWAIKKLLRQKANYKALEGFLTVLLKEEIKINRILESESNKESAGDKYNRVDILAENSKKEIIIIEVQVSGETDYFQRMLYGTSKILTQFLHIGDEYAKLRKVYSVNIVYFDLGQGTDYVYHGKTDFYGIHDNDKLSLSERQKQVFNLSELSGIFPEYYVIKANQFNDIAKDSLDEWIYYLKNSDVKSEYTAPGLEIVKENLRVERLSKREQNTYNNHLESIRIEKNVLFTARIEGEAEGLKKGLKKGRKEGIKEGKKIGIDEGKKEAMINIAKAMLDSGEPIDKIEKFTGLNIDIIKTLNK